MKPVDQTIIDKEDGDCTRACLATILELPIDAVPNFIRYKEKWFKIFWPFLNSLGYEYYGVGFPLGEEYPKGHILVDEPNIDGYVIASVPSKSFEETGHSVVMNLDGEVVHDPNPNKAWQGVNVLKNGNLKHWMMIGSKELK
jgi:hypothetical protein